MLISCCSVPVLILLLCFGAGDDGEEVAFRLPAVSGSDMAVCWDSRCELDG